jgi:hypothetical protein
MPASPLDIGYAYNSHLSYLDHLRIADSAREGARVEAASPGSITGDTNDGFSVVTRSLTTPSCSSEGFTAQASQPAASPLCAGSPTCCV